MDVLEFDYIKSKKFEMFSRVNNKRHFECGTSSQNDQLKRSLELWLKNQCQGKEDFSKEEI